MKHCHKIAILIGLWILWGAAAAEPPIRLEGQIFIAQKNRETVKLSSVAVRFVEKKSAQAIIRGLERIRAMEDDNDEMLRRSYRLIEALPKMKPTDAEIARKTLATLRQQTLANNKEIKDLRNSCLLFPDLKVGSLFETFSAARWQEERTVQTDPEGKFSAELRAGEWFIVAWAKRTVVDVDEKYVWMVEARTGERNLLNNSNLYSWP